MDFNIGELKKMIGEMPDDAIIAGLKYGDKLQEFDYLKRILLLESKEGEKVIVFNPMGTHYFDLVEKEGYKYLKHWDELKSQTPSPTGDRDCEDFKEQADYWGEQWVLMSEKSRKQEKGIAELEKELPQLLHDVQQILSAYAMDETWTDWDESVRKRVVELQYKLQDNGNSK